MLIAFVSAAALDLVVLAWHRARERGAVARGTLLAAIHESLTWAPVVLVSLRLDDALALACAAVAGTIVANAVGLRWWS
jgi:hypothetical protein